MTLKETTKIIQIVINELKARPKDEIVLHEIAKTFEKELADLKEYIKSNPQIT